MNMACANQDCRAELKYLRGGQLFLMERQPSSTPVSATGAQAKRPVTLSRYFWLCEGCAQTYSIQRWTDEGIQLSVKPKAKRMPMQTRMYSRDWTMPGLVG